MRHDTGAGDETRGPGERARAEPHDAVVERVHVVAGDEVEAAVVAHCACCGDGTRWCGMTARCVLPYWAPMRDVDGSASGRDSLALRRKRLELQNRWVL